jgi:replicative DNA helicase
MIDIEINVLGQMMIYPTTHNYIMRLNPLWFTDYRKEVVSTMQEFYLDNQPINLASIAVRFRPHIKEIAAWSNRVTTNMYIEQEILQLEMAFKKHNLQNKIAYLDYNIDLSELITKINTLLVENTVYVNGQSKPIGIIAGEVIDTLQEAIKRGTNITGIPTGWRYLDKYLGGYNKGNMIVIAGRPGSGKTAIALSLALDCCNHAKVLFISLEMSKEELAKRYLSYICDLENYKIRSAKVTQVELDAVTTKLYDLDFNFFIDDGSNSDINEIVGKIKLHKAKHGLDIVYIDYMQLIKSHQKVREQEIAHISRTLKMLAKELGITIVALAQLSRETEKRSDKKPMLSDLRESGQIEQDADIVLFPFRPAYYADEKPDIEMDAELIIGKNRHGQCVSIPMSFEGAYTRYKELL